MPIFKSSSALASVEISYEITEPLFSRPILFLHGNMASRNWWSILRERAAATCANVLAHQDSIKTQNHLFPAVLVDFPGCGQSPLPENQELIDVRVFAEVFTELLQMLQRTNSFFQQSSCLLVGHSTGGLIAILMLAKAAIHEKRQHDQSLGFPSLFGAVTINSVGPQGVHAVVLQHKIDELIQNSAHLTAMMKTTMRYSDKLQNFLATIAVPDARFALLQIGGRLVQSMAQQDFAVDFQQVTQPVLIIYGEDDLVLPKQHAEQMSQALKNSKLIFVPDTGHSMNVENPDQLLKVISEFVVDR